MFIANVLFFTLVFLLPTALCNVARLSHPAPWVSLLLGVLTLATQPKPSAKDLVTDASDRFSAIAILVGIIATLLPASIEFASASVVPDALGSQLVIGTGLAAFGLGLRLWAIRTLGKFFTATAQVQADHTVVDRGPYRWVRHPSYTGSMLTVLGIALILGSRLGVVLAAVLTFPAYLYRIRVEEQLLLASLGVQYQHYCERTWRLLPPLL